jgi:hypothetical protein
MRKVALAALLALLLVSIVLLGTTTQNEGCLPWQERVGYGDGVFGDDEDVSRCAGSRLPFGAVMHVASWDRSTPMLARAASTTRPPA